MEIRDLYPFVLLLIMVGMVIGIGVIIIDSLADASRISTPISNESFTMPAQNATVSLSHGNITSMTQILNSSGSALPSTNYSVDLDTGVLNNTHNETGFEEGETLYAYYVYDDYDTTAASSLHSTRDAISSVATDWLPLIVIVAVLAIILTLVIRSFAGAGTGR